jgi:hypothetical protein
MVTEKCKLLYNILNIIDNYPGGNYNSKDSMAHQVPVFHSEVFTAAMRSYRSAWSARVQFL